MLITGRWRVNASQIDAESKKRATTDTRDPKDETTFQNVRESG
jgi:hypothetical protein